MVVSRKMKNKITMGSSNSISGEIPERNERKVTHVRSSVSHNTQKVDATQLLIDNE